MTPRECRCCNSGLGFLIPAHQGLKCHFLPDVHDVRTSCGRTVRRGWNLLHIQGFDLDKASIPDQVEKCRKDFGRRIADETIAYRAASKDYDVNEIWFWHRIYRNLSQLLQAEVCLACFNWLMRNRWEVKHLTRDGVKRFLTHGAKMQCVNSPLKGILWEYE